MDSRSDRRPPQPPRVLLSPLSDLWPFSGNTVGDGHALCLGVGYRPGLLEPRGLLRSSESYGLCKEISRQFSAIWRTKGL